MRPRATLVIVGLIAGTTGCSNPFSRPYHPDPFGAPRQARVTGAEIVTNAPRSNPQFATSPPASGVVQAGYEETTTANNSARGKRNWIRPGDRDDSNLLDDSNDLISFADSARESARGVTRATAQSGAMLDHAPDYSWIQGTLENSAFGGGTWRVRYAPLSADDEHGGAVTLDRLPDGERLTPGDTVYVEGQLATDSQSRSTHSPLYRVRRINRVSDEGQR